MTETQELFELADKLHEAATKPDFGTLERIVKAAEAVGKSWCGSWWGYHSKVYYRNFQPAPPGAHFSIGEGLLESFYPETTGDWVEYDFDSVVRFIENRAGDATLSEYHDLRREALELHEDAKAKILSTSTVMLHQQEPDGFLQDLIEKVKKCQPLKSNAFAEYSMPAGSVISRDTVALQAGLQIPPHIAVMSQAMALQSVFAKCEELAKLASRGGSHLENLQRKITRARRAGTNVFIGHGRSKAWKELNGSSFRNPS